MASPLTSDGFACHLVPTSITKAEGDGPAYTISATAVFTPTPLADSASSNGLLEGWPTKLAKLFDDRKIMIRARPALSSTRGEVIDYVPVSLFDASYQALIDSKIYANKPAVLGTLNGLWTTWFAPNGTFAELRALLASSASSTAATAFADMMQPVASGTTTKIPDIVAVPRAELGRKLTLARARDLLENATSALSAEAGSLRADRMGWINRLKERPYTAQPWAKIAPEKDRKKMEEEAARAVAGSLTLEPFQYEEKSISDWMMKLKSELQTERLLLDRAIGPELKKKRQQAADYAGSRRNCNTSADPQQVFTDLFAVSMTVPLNPLHGAASASVGDRGAFETDLNQDLAIYAAATLPDYGDEVRPIPSAITTRWHSLQTMHSLARMVHLVVDVQFRIDSDQLDALTSEDKSSRGGSSARYLEFALDAQGYVSPRLWTLSKLRMPADDDPGYCWPTTIEEWATMGTIGDLIRTGEVPLDEVDGVVDLEAYVKPAGGEVLHRRYDVLSVDMHLAAEAEIKRQRTLATLAEAASESKGALPQDDLDQAAETSTLKTAGLQIVDRWRQAAAVREFVSSCDQMNLDERRVDASDLKIGYKIDVGSTKGAEGGRIWRSLTDRHISYGSSLDDHIDIEALLAAFLPKLRGDVDVRRELDGAVLASGSRLLQNAGQDVDHSGGEKTAFAEQILGNWDGDPLGQRTGVFTAFAGPNALPVHQKVTLPEKIPFRLRFGRSYSLGMRNVLMGGVAVPIEAAAKQYDFGMGTGMAYPASRTELMRFLRHERIGGPIVATDANLLVNEFASERRGIDGKMLVVRSHPDDPPDADEEWRFRPEETSRILFAPAVDLSFATLHGVYDRRASKIDKTRPAGGLQDLDYDSDWGGFPVFDPAGPATLSAIRGQYHADEKPKQSAEKTIIHPEAVPSGFAAVRARRKGSTREKEFYPDPAARHMVIALRRPDDANGYLKGRAICVPLYPGMGPPDPKAGTPGYPDARPVVLRVKTYSGPVSDLLAYDNVRARAGLESDDDWPIGIIGNGKAKEVTIWLARGEDFEIETWCVPDESHLLAWFDLPEALALLRNSVALEGKQLAAFGVVPSGGQEAGAAWVARRGEDTIPWPAVRHTAHMLHEAVLSRPLPEIAAVRRLRVTHAAGLPKREPVFASSSPALKLLRLKQGTLDGNLKDNWEQWGPDDSEDGGREILIGGAASLDAETTERLELRVRAASLKGEAFDDPRRGRSFDARARGLWPRTERNPKTGELVPVLLGAEPKAKHYMRELFGFDVAPDGRVSLSASEGVLANWPVPRGSDVVNLLRLTQIAMDSAKVADAVDARRTSPIEKLFPDTRARRVVVSLAGTSRTARHIPERQSYPTEAQRRADGTRLHAISDETEVILRATERPTTLTAKSLLPAFTWGSEESIELPLGSRRTKVRIRVRRPWWTSGEDERLGIVVWPPNIMHAIGKSRDGWTAEELKKGIVQRVEPIGRPSEIDLHHFASKDLASWREGFFSDADLGPGGKYITRWGSDPIFNADDVSWFIPYDAFYDLRDLPESNFAEPIDMIAQAGNETGALWPREDGYKPRFVENVLMPIPDDDGQENNPQKPKTVGARPEFMMVSLVTYMPRFDPDFEHWYVDVDLDVGHARDPFVRFGLVRFQPHADRHMQVSAPDYKWVQVVNYDRRASVTRQQPGPNDAENAQQWIWVKVFAASGADAEGDSVFAEDDAQSLPQNFRVTLIERRRLPLGQISERVARIELPEEECKARGVSNGRIEIEGPATAGTSVLWSGKLPLPQVPEDDPDLTYSVLIVEYLTSESTTYSNEPIRSPSQIKEEERWIESGPRFAVRLDVEKFKTAYGK